MKSDKDDAEYGSEYTYGSEEEVVEKDQEYLNFLKEYGHIDFSLLRFLPVNYTANEIKQIRQSEIFSELHDQNEEQSFDSNDFYGFEEKIVANRFDFQFNKFIHEYSKQDLIIDSEGHKLRSSSDKQCRVVSQECIFEDLLSEREDLKSTLENKLNFISKILKKCKYYF
jgi:hypothetical protein